MLQKEFTITGDVFVRQATATSYTFDNASGTALHTNLTYAAKNEPLIGTLNITLDGGFRTTVPHYELVNPDRGDGADSSYALRNNGRIQSSITTDPTDFDILLSGVLGAGVYMLIDYECGTVSLARANLNPSPDVMVPVLDEHERR
jgi:hypothetical protein